jgi:hypothetical protein
VSVTVGAGGPTGASGGTSSFGPAVSTTGGSTSPAPSGTPGTATVSSGTALKTGFVRGQLFGPQGSVGILSGQVGNGPPGPTAGIAYSTTGLSMAGGNATFNVGGVGGAVVVEFVG